MIRLINEEIVLNMSESKGWPYPHYTDAIVHTFAPAALMSTGLCENADEAAVAIRREDAYIPPWIRGSEHHAGRNVQR